MCVFIGFQQTIQFEWFQKYKSLGSWINVSIYY